MGEDIGEIRRYVEKVRDEAHAEGHAAGKAAGRAELAAEIVAELQRFASERDTWAEGCDDARLDLALGSANGIRESAALVKRLAAAPPARTAVDELADVLQEAGVQPTLYGRSIDLKKLGQDLREDIARNGMDKEHRDAWAKEYRQSPARTAAQERADVVAELQRRMRLYERDAEAARAEGADVDFLKFVEAAGALRYQIRTIEAGEHEGASEGGKP